MLVFVATLLFSNSNIVDNNVLRLSHLGMRQVNTRSTNMSIHSITDYLAFQYNRIHNSDMGSMVICLGMNLLQIMSHIAISLVAPAIARIYAVHAQITKIIDTSTCIPSFLSC
jgi:hypothetical protein